MNVALIIGMKTNNKKERGNKMKLQKRQIVNVEMTYYNSQGEITKRNVADRIEKLEMNLDCDVWTERCHLVGEDQISEATPEQIRLVEKEDSDAIEMLKQGDRLMNALQEPEFI